MLNSFTILWPEGVKWPCCWNTSWLSWSQKKQQPSSTIVIMLILQFHQTVILLESWRGQVVSHLFKCISKPVLIFNHIILQGGSSEKLQPQVSAYSHTGNLLSKACYFVTFSCLQPLFSICLVNIENFHPLKPGNVTFFSCRSCCTGRNASCLTLSPTTGRLFLFYSKFYCLALKIGDGTVLNAPCTTGTTRVAEVVRVHEGHSLKGLDTEENFKS